MTKASGGLDRVAIPKVHELRYRWCLDHDRLRGLHPFVRMNVAIAKEGAVASKGEKREIDLAASCARVEDAESLP